jgi:hypothetical protein
MGVRGATNETVDEFAASREAKRAMPSRRVIYATAILLALALSVGILHATREASGSPAALRHGRVAVVPHRLAVSTQRLTGRATTRRRERPCRHVAGLKVLRNAPPIWLKC